MAAGGTGYSLPWDARAFFSTRVAEGLMAGLPFAGRMARLWLLGRQRYLNTHTLALLCASCACDSGFYDRRGCLAGVWFEHRSVLRPALLTVARLVQCSRSAICGVSVAALAFWSLKYPAPLGPSVPEMTAEYLPRPGSQFLWLYQSLKYIPGGFGSIAGVVLPGIVLLILVGLPWLKSAEINRRRDTGACVVLVVTMTSASYLSDRRDQKTWTQLSRQAAQEEALRREPFKPALIRLAAATGFVEIR